VPVVNSVFYCLSMLVAVVCDVTFYYFMQGASHYGIQYVQLVPESPVIAVNKSSKLFLRLSTMTVRNSSLSVDFGDNCSTTAALHPLMASAANNTEDSVDRAAHGDGKGVVRIFQNNYRLTCKLYMEISHIYTVEGDFNISVTAFAARSADITVARNWTVLSVRSAVENVSLLMDSVVAVHQNVTAKALVSPISRFVKYYWTVLGFDFMRSGMNSSVVFSAVTEIPEVQLVLADVGDYLVVVTIDNELGVVNDSIIVSAAVPVSALSLSCDDAKHFSTNASFDCVATVEKGTDVGFVWDARDAVSVRVATSNGSSTAVATYSAVGWYNITVTAWNRLGTESVWKMVNVVENVFRLSVLATEPVLVGKPIRVMACCMLGLNLTLEFDFGSGSHQLLLDSESHIVTASHVYRLPGVHLVTVTAQNNASMAVTHVSVNVLENVADVDLKPVSALVAGRHSVFIATFNGNFMHSFVIRLTVCFTDLT